MLKNFEELREKYYAINDGEFILCPRPVDAPVIDKENKVIRAVNIALSSSVFSLQRKKNEKNLCNHGKDSLFKGGDNDEILNFWR